MVDAFKRSVVARSGVLEPPLPVLRRCADDPPLPGGGGGGRSGDGSETCAYDDLSAGARCQVPDRSDATRPAASAEGRSTLATTENSGNDGAMAYDEDLANRIRELVAAEPDVTEKRMFGGLAFMVCGNMSVAASGQGGLMVRVDPDHSAALVAKPHARPFEMRGRPMQGWVRVDAEGLRTKRELEPWVKRGVAYARSLPAKQ